MTQQEDPTEAITPMLLDHAQQPRNNYPLPEFSGHARITGPCGDTMEFWVQVRDEVVERASFTTSGCAISHACGSMTTCIAEGQSLAEVAALEPEHVIRAFGGLPADHEHCALLSTNTLKAACSNSSSLGSDLGARQESRSGVVVRVALPVAAGRLSADFGHCERFALLDVDPKTMQVLQRRDVVGLSHQPELLPTWLAEEGAQVLICGAMDEGLQALFVTQGIRVVLEAAPPIPEQLISDYVAGNLQGDKNAESH